MKPAGDHGFRGPTRSEDPLKERTRETRALKGRDVASFYGEFDPGSGRTLAVCLTHASRARTRGGVTHLWGERRTGE